MRWLGPSRGGRVAVLGRMARSCRRLRYRVVRQYDASDCGPAALLTVLRFWGGDASLPHVRDLASTDTRGSTLFALVQAARRLGLDAEGCSGTYDELLQQRFPLIAYVVLEDGLRHFVVVFEASSEGVVIGDPARGLRILAREAFEAVWTTRTVMLVAPTPSLHRATPPHWLRWVAGYARRDAAWLQQVAFLGVAYTALGLLTAAFVQLLLDRLIPAGDRSKVLLAGAFLLALQVARAGLGYARHRFILELQYRVGVRVTADFLAHVFSLPPRFFATRRKGDLTSRVHDGVRIQQAMLMVCGQSIVDVMVIAAAIAGLFVITGESAWVPALFLPVFIGLLVATGRSIKRRQMEALQHYSAFESSYLDALNGADDVRSFWTGSSFSSRVTGTAERFQDRLRAVGRAEACLSLLADLAGTLFVVCGLAWGGVLVIDGRLKVGALMAAYSLMASMLPASIRLVTAVMSLRAASVAATRLLDLLLVEPERGGGRPFALQDRLELRDATFAWPDGTRVLDAASLCIRHGEVTGLTGPSGCGKSTLVRLLQRKQALGAGEVDADGVPLQDLDLESLRRGIAVAPESVRIFNGTIADNIRIGRGDVADLRRLLEHTRLAESGPLSATGLLTVVGEDARQLSAGERQIVGLLRAMLDDPQLLVIDEGVGALDDATARQVLELVRNYARRRAVLLISHSPAVLEWADRVYRFDDGRIVPLARPSGVAIAV